MVKKRSFAEKAMKVRQKQAFSMVKYVKATVSEKTGHTRFQETMVKVPTGMTLDAYLKQEKEGKGKKAEIEKATGDEQPVKETEEVAKARDPKEEPSKEASEDVKPEAEPAESAEEEGPEEGEEGKEKDS